MPRLAHLVLASGMALAASAQSSSASGTQVFLPMADQQALVASVIGESPNDVKTLAIGCPAGADSNDCGFPESFTVTAGPSTFRFAPVSTGIYHLLGEIDCTITGTTEAVCAATVGAYDTDVIATATDTDWLTSMPASSTSDTATLSGTELAGLFVEVTITAGAESGAGASTTDTAASETASRASESMATSTSSGSGMAAASTMSAGSAGGSSSTSSAGVAIATDTGAAAGSLSGLAYSGAVAAGFIALPMLLL